MNNMTKDRVCQILLNNGFAIKEGFEDLKPYVYGAISALLREASFLPAALPHPDERGSNNYVNGWAHGCGAMRVALQGVADELALAVAAGPQTACVCGSPDSTGVVHRANGPCHAIQVDAANLLSDDHLTALTDQAFADDAAIMERIKTAEFHPDQLGEEFEELLHSLAHKCHDAGLGESTRHFDVDEVAPDQVEHLRMHVAEMLNKARAGK